MATTPTAALPTTQSTNPNAPNYVPPSILGYDPRPAYQAYLQQMQLQQSQYSGRDQANDPIGFNDWFSAQAINSGTYGISNLLQAAYANATGQEMPPALQQQAYRIINQLPSTVQQEILAAGGTDYLAGGTTNVSKLLGSIGPLQNFLYGASGGAAGSQILTPAQSRAQTLQNQLASQYQSIFGHEPSASQLSAMSTMNNSDLTNYLNNQQYKMGLTYGQWTVAESNINKQYMNYFGRNATDQEVAWANGKSADDIQSHIMTSPSRVDGLSMGQYTNYHNMLSSESARMFGYDAPDEMIKAFHTATQGKEGV